MGDWSWLPDDVVRDNPLASVHEESRWICGESVRIHWLDHNTASTTGEGGNNWGNKKGADYANGANNVTPFCYNTL